MIQTKKVLPEVYSESFDMSIFTGLLDLIYTARELNASRAKVLHNPIQCFEEDVPRLASLFNLSTTATRQLLSNYRLMVKYKGTPLAIKALASFAAAIDPTEDYVKIVKSFDTATKYSKVTAYLDFSTMDGKLLEQLIYKLAPVRTFVQVRHIGEIPS